MLVSCKWCGRMHPRGTACPKKPTRAKDPKLDAAARIRNTQKWKKCRAAVRERDGGMCRWCLANGRVNFDCVQAHHIKPLAGKGNERFAFDEDWVISLCSRGEESCHAKADAGEIDPARLHELAVTPPTIEEKKGLGRWEDPQKR